MSHTTAAEYIATELENGNRPFGRVTVGRKVVIGQIRRSPENGHAWVLRRTGSFSPSFPVSAVTSFEAL